MRSLLAAACVLVADINAQDTLSSGMTNFNDITSDWMDQDDVASKGYRAAITAIINLPGLPRQDKSLLQTRLYEYAKKSDNSPEIKGLYYRACSARRALRMKPYLDKFSKVIFSQHPIKGGYYFYADVQHHPGYEGKGLELLTMNKNFGSVTHLLPSGVARDPCVSFDGKKVLFSWRGGTSGSKTYHVYEMNLADRTTRQITRDGASGPSNDFEAVYLPNGNIVFNSTRHIQQVDCVNPESPVCNLFLCDKDGNYVRQIGFDQSPTSYPVVMPSGEVLYARWDYNDKSHTYAHPLFIMNPDGTQQREYCNGNSWWPSNILQARPIPGTNKVMAMLCGYHTTQAGKIGIIDVSKGLQNGEGVTLLVPVRHPKDDNINRWGGRPNSKYRKLYTFDASKFIRPNAYPMDRWGQDSPMFCHPFPLHENAFLVSYRPKYRDAAWGPARFGLYFFLAEGERELLFFDKAGSAMAAVAALPQPTPPVLASSVDYRDSTGVFQIMDIYNSQSPVLDGVKRGTIKRLRVLGLKYRSGPVIGRSSHYGAGCLNFGGSAISCPIATPSASWDAKIVVGETPVYEDGSASFIAPARMPLFFQAIDDKGHMVQTMRSWSTLQPGETFACMGCHESKLSAPPPLTHIPEAMRVGPKPLEPFYGPMRGFSYAREVQPIFNAKCVKCHDGTNPSKLDLRDNRYKTTVSGKTNTRKKWPASYCALTDHPEGVTRTKYVSWLNAEDSPVLLPPYRKGSFSSPMVQLLEKGHKSVVLTKEEHDKICAWIDMGVPCFADYGEGVIKTSYLEALAEKRKLRDLWKAEERKNIEDYITATVMPARRPYSGGLPLAKSPDKLSISANSRSGNIHIFFSLSHGEGLRPVQIQLFNLKGVLVRTLLDEHRSTGRHNVAAKHGSIAPGHYFLRLQTPGVEKTAPCLIF